MVGLFQKRRPVPQDGVLAVHTTGAAQQFRKQLEVDEIAIQAASCGNRWVMLWGIHGFVSIARETSNRLVIVVCRLLLEVLWCLVYYCS